MVVGDDLYGAVDQVPGHFYIATRFFHFSMFPMIPLRSYLVIDGTEMGPGILQHGSFKGWPIGWNLKSIVVGWIRAILTLSAIVTGFVAFISLVSYFQSKPDADLVRTYQFGAACTLPIALALGSRKLTVASHGRIERLAKRLKRRYPDAAHHVQDYLDTQPQPVLEE